MSVHYWTLEEIDLERRINDSVRQMKAAAKAQAGLLRQADEMRRTAAAFDCEVKRLVAMRSGEVVEDMERRKGLV